MLLLWDNWFSRRISFQLIRISIKLTFEGNEKKRTNWSISALSERA